MDRHRNRADHSHTRDGARNRLIARTVLWSLWLPVSVEVVFAVGDFSYGIYDDRPLEFFLTIIVYWLPLMWVLGMPLTIAVQLIYRVSGASRGSGILAFAVAAITAPISVYAYFLSVPLPSFLNTLFGAALAWLAAALLCVGMMIRRVFLRAAAGNDHGRRPDG